MLHVTQKTVTPTWDDIIDHLPDAVKDTTFCLYGFGEQADEPRSSYGSILLRTCTDEGTDTDIPHLAIGDSSPKNVGRNVTHRYNILQKIKINFKYQLEMTGLKPCS